VVVGNICRQDHPEAAFARESGIPFASFPRTVHDLFLVNREPIVIAGTHGKTTTTALTAYLLEATGRDPSILVGGVTHNFGHGFKLGNGKNFVIEGDEYDSAYFEKVPKFSFYAPHAAVITSVEHDHVDIYPTVEAYEEAFAHLVEQVSPGPLAVYSGDEGARRIAALADCPVITYGVKGDPFQYEPAWLAVPRASGSFELQVEGIPRGIFEPPMAGRHNIRNVLAALIMAHRAAGVPLAGCSRRCLDSVASIDASRSSALLPTSPSTMTSRIIPPPCAAPLKRCVRNTPADGSSPPSSLAPQRPAGRFIKRATPARSMRPIWQSSHLPAGFFKATTG